jgi:uncharacterized pyridoxamine 5'-phosphate oxidase family protein
MKITSAISEDIRRISEHTKALFSSGLTERAYVILISEATKVSRPNVEKVLKALPQLEKLYTKDAK